MESQKVVLKLYVHDDRDKKRAMKAVSNLSGVESLNMNMKDMKLTVTGTVDVVDLGNKLRKICQTDILTVGPAKDPVPKPKPIDECAALINAYRPYECYPRPYYYNNCVEEKPNACVIM